MTRVLVVEDEESFSDALSYMLRKEGYDVAIASNGVDAIDDFDRNGADLVLLDLMLPGVSGTEVCRVNGFCDNVVDVDDLRLPQRVVALQTRQ